MKNEPKLSAIMKAIAEKMLAKPHRVPSSEAMHTAHGCAHAGWNRALGRQWEYAPLIKLFEAERPRLWRKFKLKCAEDLVAFAEAEKTRQWPDDERIILVCGMTPESNIRVE